MSSSTKGIHVFKRTYAFVTPGSTTYDTITPFDNFDMSVNLQLFPNYIELTQLFDEYRIKSVTWKFMPSQINAENTGTGVLGVTPAQVSTLSTVEDRTDGTPISLSAMMNYQSFQTVLLDKTRRRTFRNPCVATQLYVSAIAAGYSPLRSPWINADDNTVPHYCGKGALSNKAAAATCVISYTIYVSAVIECRNVR